MIINSLTEAQRHGFVAAMTSTWPALSAIPRHVPCWTWQEAIEVANRCNATGRAKVRREGARWVVRYNAPIHLVNRN